jgi:hypothetical protein
MRLSKAAIVLAVSLALAVPSFGSPSDDRDPGRDRSSAITRIIKHIRHFLLGSNEQPAVPIP